MCKMLLAFSRCGYSRIYYGFSLCIDPGIDKDSYIEKGLLKMNVIKGVIKNEE